MEETRPKKKKKKPQKTCIILFIYNSGKCKLVYLDEKITCRGGGAGGRVEGRGQTMFTILTMILSWVYTCQHVDFPGSSDGKESACNVGDLGLIPGLGRSWSRKWQLTPVFWPGESHGQRSLVGYSPWGRKE